MIVKLEACDDGSGALMLPLGHELCLDMGWEIGDVLTWTDNGDGSFSIAKPDVETELVLVETISTFRLSYVVEVPKGKKEWALDTVVLEEAHEVAQAHLGEQIVSHRVVTMDEVKVLAREDNDWLSDTAIERSITLWDENGNI